MLNFTARMIISGLRFATTASLAILLTSVPAPSNISDPAIIALWGVVITSIAGVVLQILRSRADANRDERRHRFEMEDRAESRKAQQEIYRALEENARLVETGTVRAEAAYRAANDINAKIAKLAAAALNAPPEQRGKRATSALATLRDEEEVERHRRSS